MDLVFGIRAVVALADRDGGVAIAEYRHAIEALAVLGGCRCAAEALDAGFLENAAGGTAP